ncbi:hypothetical protein ACJMK2_029917 [Sinanodonta woodiana]|uniref:RING-type domain-containing protein n=1 Tax=Sinanodonta woodiana TaxID=1069815 RepID=A0ABD3XFN2_SINWO
MEVVIDRSVIRIHLKTTKKNDRMDVCSRYLKMVRNSVIIINKLFETVFIFPEALSNHEVQSCMQRNSYRTFPSLHKCICSLNQQNQNVVLINTNCVYAMEETDCLVKNFLDLSSKYKNVTDLEYDSVKNCLQDKNILENGQKDGSDKHTDNFESVVDCVNTKCKILEKKNTVQMRRKILKPRTKIKDEFLANKYVLHLKNTFTIPIFKTYDCKPAVLMALVNSPMDPYSLCTANVSFGEIVYDGEGTSPAVPQPQLSNQGNTINDALNNTPVSNNNPTQGRRLEGSSNSKSVSSSIPSTHEQHGNQQNLISSERMSGGEHFNLLNNSTGGTSVQDFTADDRIRCPKYHTYHSRLSTFTKWPSDMTQTPELVAQAGFYYTGLQDVVRCFACDGGLKNWDPEDDPWIEHARWFPSCPFVQKVKGQEYVELVRRMTEESDEEEDVVVHSTFQRNNPMAHPPDLQQLNIGNDTDKRKFTSEDIMTIILEKEDRGELLPIDGRSELTRTLSQSFRSTHSTTEVECCSLTRCSVEILRQNESLKVIVTCIKCKAQSRNILFLPCKHLCLCQDCAQKCSLCPVCYKIVHEKIKTFMI